MSIDFPSILWVFVAVGAIPVSQQRRIAAPRLHTPQGIEHAIGKERSSRLITPIRRPLALAVLGMPIYRDVKYEFMRLYPQSNRGRHSVQYVLLLCRREEGQHHEIRGRNLR